MEDEGARRRLKLDGPGGGASDGGADLLSALSDDLLHEVLVRLRCARAAARTSVLSRRWRGLWTQLPDLVFRKLTVARILPALASIQGKAGAGVSILVIRVPTHHGLDDAGVPSLLRAAAGLSPVDFTLSLPRILDHVDVDLPRFPRATSIQLYVENLRITLPPPVLCGGGFPKLEKLYLALPGCCVDLAALVLGCPSLRLLWMDDVCSLDDDDGVDIRSESLQELYVRTGYRWIDRINVEAPVLKKLAMLFCTKAIKELSVSVVAPPVLEKVSWVCSSYCRSRMIAGFGPWGLSELSLNTAETPPGDVNVTITTGAAAGEEDTCLMQQLSTGRAGEDTRLQLLPNVISVLSLKMKAHGWFDAELNFVQQIEKQLVANFSVLELIMQHDWDTRSARHVYGPFVLHLLGSHRIRTATRRLHILLEPSKEVKNECPVSCLCDEPKNWRSKTVSLFNLEEVVIDGFEFEDHELDFLKLMFRCSPMLKRMAVGTLYKVTTSDGCCTELFDVFKAHPLVECKLIPH